MSKKKVLPPSELKVYPHGLKLFEVEFDYSCDIGIPGARPINVRFNQNYKNIDLASIQLERMQGCITIDTARKSSNNKSQTTSVKRIPKNTPTLRIGLEGTEPLHYRLFKYTRIIAPSYRTKVKVRLFSEAETSSEVVTKAMKVFNQFLKAYRVASGDPVPLVSENEHKELRIINFKFSLLPNENIHKDFDVAMKTLRQKHLDFQGGPQVGLSTNDIDMIGKPYIKEHALETIRLAFLPEEIKVHTELVLEAIEKAYRSQDYGIGIVMLNTAFEASLVESLIMSLVLLDYDETAIDQYFSDNSSLEDKLKVVDGLRQQACQKYGVTVPKKFRGSAEESRWKKSTYQKRHWSVHVVRDKDAHPLKRNDFEKALKDTQVAIEAIEVPLMEIKVARQKRQRS